MTLKALLEAEGSKNVQGHVEHVKGFHGDISIIGGGVQESDPKCICISTDRSQNIFQIGKCVWTVTLTEFYSTKFFTS